MPLENQGEEVSALGRTPEPQALLSGCVLAAILKNVVKHDLRLIKNPDASWGRGFKPRCSFRVYCGEEAKRLWTHPRSDQSMQAPNLCFIDHWVALLQSIWLYIG